MKSSFRLLTFPFFQDERGWLTPYEFDDAFPFPVKRAYLLHPQKKRGGHAHKIEEEVFIAIQGRIEAHLHDGTSEHVILLDHPTKGLYVPRYCWHEFPVFSEDALMLCFSSTHYLPGEKNYITDKTAFLTFMKQASAL